MEIRHIYTEINISVEVWWSRMSGGMVCKCLSLYLIKGGGTEQMRLLARQQLKGRIVARRRFYHSSRFSSKLHSEVARHSYVAAPHSHGEGEVDSPRAW